MNNVELTLNQSKYINELTQWVNSTFGNFLSFHLFQQAFNEYFQNYQRDFAKKMDINSIKEGNISCSSAALVVATWWSLQYETEPEFLIILKLKSPQRRHVVLALPYIKALSIEHLKESFEDQSNMKPPLIVELRYKNLEKTEYSLQHAGKEVFKQQQHNVTGIQNFVQNRFQIFNYHPQHPSQPTGPSSSPSTRLTPAEQQQR